MEAFAGHLVLIETLDQIDSTNEEAKRRLEAGEKVARLKKLGQAVEGSVIRSPPTTHTIRGGGVILATCIIIKDCPDRK